MTEGVKGVDLQEKLSRFHRDNIGGIKDEKAVVTATGAMPPAWTIKIDSLESCNLYNVHLVNINAPGVNPSPITGGIHAYNIAESFTGTGSVSSGTYAVMWRVAGNNVFYIKP